MKRWAFGLLLVVLFGIGCAHAEEFKRRTACDKIPQRALVRADKALRAAYPQWNVVPAEGEDGEWRCKTNGMYVRRYDKAVEGKQVRISILLYVDKDGSIYIAEKCGCFSIDRWK